MIKRGSGLLFYPQFHSLASQLHSNAHWWPEDNPRNPLWFSWGPLSEMCILVKILFWWWYESVLCGWAQKKCVGTDQNNYKCVVIKIIKVGHKDEPVHLFRTSPRCPSTIPSRRRIVSAAPDTPCFVRTPQPSGINQIKILLWNNDNIQTAD